LQASSYYLGFAPPAPGLRHTWQLAELHEVPRFRIFTWPRESPHARALIENLTDAVGDCGRRNYGGCSRLWDEQQRKTDFGERNQNNLLAVSGSTGVGRPPRME